MVIASKSVDFQVPFALHVFFLLMNAFVVGVATYQAPLVSAVGFGVALSGLAVYFILVYPKRLPSFLTAIDSKQYLFPAFSGMNAGP